MLTGVRPRLVTPGGREVQSGEEERETSGRQLVVILLIWMLVTWVCLISRHSLVRALSSWSGCFSNIKCAPWEGRGTEEQPHHSSSEPHYLSVSTAVTPPRGTFSFHNKLARRGGISREISSAPHGRGDLLRVRVAADMVTSPPPALTEAAPHPAAPASPGC